MTWILTVEAMDGDNNQVTLRFSTGYYDSPDSALYDPRIIQPGLFVGGMYSQLLDSSRSGYGETTLRNEDRGLDYLADYAVDGRLAILSEVIGGVATEALRGTVAGLIYDSGTVSVKLREPEEVLRLTHPHATYAGDNTLPDGLEGTANDIRGTIKPRVYGDVRSAEPVLVNTSKLIYQISDQPCEISGLYENGAAITQGADYASLTELQSTAPSAGQWRSYEGYARMGSPPGGVITVDASTSSPGAGDVFSAIAEDASQTVDTGDITELNAAGNIGIFVSTTTTTQALLDLIADSIAGYYRFSVAGILRAMLIETPSDPVLTIEDYQLLSIKRSATGAGDNGLPVWRVQVKADKVERTIDDTAGIVSEADKSRLANEYRESFSERTSTRDRHPLATEINITSALRSLNDAQVVADRVADLTSVRRDRVSADVSLLGTQGARVGDVVRLEVGRLGYSSGRDMIVVKRQLNALRGRQTLELWG